ncbi:hypothetical protein VNO77_29787 [Canavalia gladiata]|uniref:Uncharacterized protein n=1 Tax=Canavalia gladiata TaxID=3824 RepID=A0AAN9KNU1_CANGL
MEDKYSVGKKHSGIWKSLRDEDFEEEDVWDVLKNRSDYSGGIRKSKEKDHSSSLSAPTRPIPIASRMIPRVSNSSGSGSASSSNEAKKSASVNIPEWSKIYKNNQNRALKSNASRLDDYDSNHNAVVDAENDGGDSDDEYEEKNDEYDSKLPPHEFIAKRLARSQISSFSVLEGAGRTLKGRDLSKVRNAVLTKTGFLESL